LKQGKGPFRFAPGMKILQFFQVDLEESISVEHQKRLCQTCCGMQQPPAGTEWGRFYCVVDRDTLIGGPEMVTYGLIPITDG